MSREGNVNSRISTSGITWVQDRYTWFIRYCENINNKPIESRWGEDVG